MNLLDIILVLILLSFVYKGAKQGIAYMIGQALGIMIGILIASRIFDEVARFIQPLFLDNYTIAAIFSFIVIFQIINELLGLILNVINIFAFWQHLPIFSTLDKWIGALLGLFVGNLIIGVVLYFLIHTPTHTFLDQLLAGSTLTPLFINFASFLIAFFPDEFKALPSLIEKL